MDLYNHYQNLYQLTQTQQEYIKESNYDQLLKVLNQKNELMDKIDKIDTKEYLKQQDNPEQALACLQKLVGKIKELEDKNQEIIMKDKEKLAGEIKDFNKKQKTRNGYQSTDNYEAKFIDKKS